MSKDTQVVPSNLPDFTLDSTSGIIKLDEFARGSRKVLVFYPADNSPVCSSQLSIYNQALPIFDRYHAKIIGISTDSKTSHTKFAKNLNLHFPLVLDTDQNTHESLAKTLDVYNEKEKVAKRAIFVYDEHDHLVWNAVYPDHVNPGADGILQALDSLNT